MKTKIVTLITLLVVSATTLTYAATTIDSASNAQDSIREQTTVLADITNINEIEASGNVEVYVTSGDKDQVKVCDNYYTQNGLVQAENGVLRISSYTKDKLIVMVTVTDLRAITADYNAVIKSTGTLSALELNVNLNSNAAAYLKLDAFAAVFTVNDTAKAFLSGDVNDYELDHSTSSNVHSAKLVAANRTETIITVPAVTPAKQASHEEIEVFASL
jgi:hypothetical protein